METPYTFVASLSITLIGFILTYLVTKKLRLRFYYGATTQIPVPIPQQTSSTANQNNSMPNQAQPLIVLFLLIVCCVSPINTYAGWYVGGSVLLHPVPYHPIGSNYIKLGTSKLEVLSNGISINAGYKFCLHNYVLASEFDIGSFSDADGDITYQGLKHYISASYYLAIKQKLGFHVKPNFMVYGLLGFSQNSIGDRVYSTAEYFNKKQLSFLYGGGLEYYTKRDNKIALFAESFYFTPTNMTLYSGGAKPPSGYSLSAYGVILQFGMRYYFD